MTKISYAITVCDEHVEIQKLLPLLLVNKKLQDEVVVLWDNSKKSTSVEDYLRSHSINGEFAWHQDTFDGHFANWKNKLNSCCSGDYIFQLDADELISKDLIENLHLIVDSNPEVDLFYLPRINIVTGLTEQHIKQWNWQVDAANRVNYPDYQTRLFKNTESIKWANKVHEVVIGYTQYTTFPLTDALSIFHEKTIEKQEKQNNYYNTL